MEKVLDALEWCEGLIISPPVYYRNVMSLLGAMLERLYAKKDSNILRDKPGGSITVGRGSGGGQSIVLNILYNWMRSSRMICISGELNGVSAMADKPGDILNDQRKLNQAEMLARNILDIYKKMNR